MENKYFTKLTDTVILNTAKFVIGTAAVDGNDFIVYNSGTGVLSYDADGNRAEAAVQIAVLGVTTHPVLTYADFVVV